MKENPPSNGKVACNLKVKIVPSSYHAPHCDGRSACMLQSQEKQKNKDGKEVKHQDHFRCTITCRHCGKRRHYEDECHKNAASPRNLRKRKRSGVTKPARINPREEATMLGDPLVRVTLVMDEGPQPPNRSKRSTQPHTQG